MSVISKKIEKELSRMAKHLGISRREVLSHAVASYQKDKTVLNLRDELRLWDAVSTADFSTFERKI